MAESVFIETAIPSELAREMAKGSVVPERSIGDAFHIACSGVHGIDYLLTWNCKHIANPHIQRRIRECFADSGILPPVICTPEEFFG